MKNYEKYEYEKRMKNSFFAKDHENIFFFLVGPGI